MTLYLSRLRIARDPAVSALNALLDPEERARGMDAHHRLLWSAFAGDPDAKRDFLWREDSKGVFLVLSARAPGPSPFFDPPEVKLFAPHLRAGDQLGFVLRANATRTRKLDELAPNGKRKKDHIDLVMDSLPPKGMRDEMRMSNAQQVAESWLTGQGERNGFRIDQVIAGDYSVVQFEPGKRGRPRFGVLELTGVLSVESPDLLAKKLASGFGRAKAFGCGLMLVRRV